MLNAAAVDTASSVVSGVGIAATAGSAVGVSNHGVVAAATTGVSGRVEDKGGIAGSAGIGLNAALGTVLNAAADAGTVYQGVVLGTLSAFHTINNASAEVAVGGAVSAVGGIEASRVSAVSTGSASSLSGRARHKLEGVVSHAAEASSVVVAAGTALSAGTASHSAANSVLAGGAGSTHSAVVGDLKVFVAGHADGAAVASGATSGAGLAAASSSTQGELTVRATLTDHGEVAGGGVVRSDQAESGVTAGALGGGAGCASVGAGRALGIAGHRVSPVNTGLTGSVVGSRASEHVHG